LDILLYLDIGMHPKTQPLAALRLAPVQCCTWGHPITTGFPTMDYFLSSELMEPPNGEQHYTEKLVRLPNLSICYPFPKLANEPRAISDSASSPPFFLCSQSLFKLLPEYDTIYPRIALRLPGVQFRFFEDKSIYGTNIFRNRLSRAFAAHGLNPDQHFMVMARVGEEGFFQLNKQALAILDTFWWSGGNTSLEALACGKPILAHAGAMMRGRHTAGILRRAGLNELILIAADADEYVDTAVRLGQDAKWRISLEEKIQAQKNRVYDDVSTVRALEDFFKAANHFSR
jgi:protein O-GlcNAc transferase